MRFPRLRLIIFGLIVVVPRCSLSMATDTLFLQTRHRYDYEKREPQHISGLLHRELARQALLIAAREELGLTTCDASLRERGTGGKDQVELMLLVNALTDGKCLLEIQKADEGPMGPVTTLAYQYDATARGAYISLAPQFEEASRGKFVEIIKDLGGIGHHKTQFDGPPLPDAGALTRVDEWLAQVDAGSQFLAIRKLHSWILQKGEHPELLGRLVNGYAQLGMLTECYWGATSKVYQARSLIYAERLKAKYPNYPFTYWHRAYAYALTGIHFASLLQLEHPLPEGVDADQLPSLPDWAAMVEPTSRCDVSALQQIADQHSSYHAWARYLAFWTIFLNQEELLLVREAKRTMVECPAAFNSYYVLAREGPLGIMRAASHASRGAMVHYALDFMAKEEGLPEEVRSVIEKSPNRKSPLTSWGNAIDQLRQQPSGGEPSWAVLANLLEETGIVVAAFNVYVAKCGSTEQPIQPHVDFFLPAIQNHPNVGLFHAKCLSLNTQPEEIRQACASVRFADPTAWLWRDVIEFRDVRNQWNEPFALNGYRAVSRDFTALSLTLETRYRNPDSVRYRNMYLTELRNVSPESPYVLVREIALHRENQDSTTPEQLLEWEERAGASGNAWQELGAIHVSREAYEDAFRCYEKSFDVSPEYRTVVDWANAYERAEQFDLVVPTFRRYLEVEDYGLGHSNIHYKIAQFLLRRDQPAKAKPYALEAAQSWSARGLRIAAVVCEWLGEEKEADRWYRELSQSYPSNSGLKWYLWRRRSGRDEIDEARRLAQQVLGGKTRLDLCEGKNWWNLVYYIMEGDAERALKYAKIQSSREPGLFSQSHLILQAVALDDTDLLRTTIEKIKEMKVEQGDNKNDATEHEKQPPEEKSASKLEKDGKDLQETLVEPWQIRYARGIQEVLAANSESDVHVELINTLVEEINPHMGLCDACYFFSQLLESRDLDELAEKYRDRAAETHRSNLGTWHLALFQRSRLKALDSSGQTTTDNSE